MRSSAVRVLACLMVAVSLVGLGQRVLFAVDKIYWTDNGASAIQRANPDGTEVENVLTGLGDPHPIVVDVYGGKIYWGESGQIMRANLDGTNVQVFPPSLGIHPALGCFFFSIALDVSGGKLYWTGCGIRRATLDST